MDMFFTVLVFFAGLFILYHGAEFLVNGSSQLAFSYGVRPLIVGMTVVAFATSMPELMVSLLAAVKGSSDMAAGNIIGSNIANIGLILGIAALLLPMAVGRATLTREIPFMIGASLLVYVFCLDGVLSFVNGLVLFLFLLVFLAYCIKTARVKVPYELDVASEAGGKGQGRRRNLLFIALGMVGLGVGAELMVRSAVIIATALGISELVIGMTVVAVGTSLPELAASVVSAWKGEMDLSVGNVIGSNIFNVLFVLGVCPMIRPLSVDPSVLRFELPVMLAFSVALIPLLWSGRKLDRPRGALLLVAYLLFIGVLFV
ncbi:calcium/sodium antiporter [Geoalkalibacter sp.]|uniref:calcium/sodium antiporter n=1 Tax=Geoalkalibacter sp. TaxID=3041440 RepID=UPI00272E80EA|nr:calcium/sodium antiporter [Geoalkalibacter sp.]